MSLLACCTCWSGHPAARGNEVMELRTPDSLVIPRGDGDEEVHRIARRENGTYALACGDVWTHDGLVAHGRQVHSVVFEICRNRTFAIYVDRVTPSPIIVDLPSTFSSLPDQWRNVWNNW